MEMRLLWIWDTWASSVSTFKERAFLDHLRMIWVYLGLGRGSEGTKKGILQWRAGGKTEHLLPAPWEQLLCPVNTLRDPPQTVWKAAYLRLIQFSSYSSVDFTTYSVPTLRGKNGGHVVEHRCQLYVCPRGKSRDAALPLSFLCSSQHLSVQLSMYFPLFEKNSYSLQILVCPIK